MGAVFHHRSELGFVKGENLMGVEVLVNSEDETKFLGIRFGDIEEVKLPGEMVEGVTPSIFTEDCWR